MMELPIGSTCQEKTTVNGNLISTKRLELDPSIQWSIGLGIGLEYRLTPVIGLYAEPSLNYFHILRPHRHQNQHTYAVNKSKIPVSSNHLTGIYYIGHLLLDYFIILYFLIFSSIALFHSL